jgi:hypothetical protein
MAERRKHPRYVVDVPARLTVGRDSLEGRIRDVCHDAALFEGARWFPLGTEVALVMELPGADGPLQATGKVVRLAPGEQGTHCMAILFDELPRDSANRTSFFIEFFIAQQEAQGQDGGR